MQSKSVMSIVRQGRSRRGTKWLARVLCIDRAQESATASAFEWARA